MKRFSQHGIEIFQFAQRVDGDFIELIDFRLSLLEVLRILQQIINGERQ